MSDKDDYLEELEERENEELERIAKQIEELEGKIKKKETTKTKRTDAEKREPMNDIERELRQELKDALFNCYLIKRFGIDKYVLMSARKDAEYHNSVLPSLWQDFEETLDRLRELTVEEYIVEFQESFGKGRTELDETTNKLLTDAYRRLVDYRRVLTERKRNRQDQVNLERVKEYNETVRKDLAEKREMKERKEQEKLRIEETKGLRRELGLVIQEVERKKVENRLVIEHNRKELRKMIKVYNRNVRRVFDEEGIRL